MSIKCLKCENGALEGKALCKECFEKHELQLQAEESEDWIRDQLATTRGGFRKKTREAHADANKKKVFQLIVAAICLSGLVGAFAAIMIFIPADPSSGPTQTTKLEHSRNGTVARAVPQKYTFVRSNSVPPEHGGNNTMAISDAPAAMKDPIEVTKVRNDKMASGDNAPSKVTENSLDEKSNQSQEFNQPVVFITPFPADNTGGDTQNVAGDAGNEELPQDHEDSSATNASLPATETPTETATATPSISPTPLPQHPS